MNAEVISIGSELTSGQSLDTNSRWISQRLGELGIDVLYHATVADNLEANLNVFRTARQRSKLVLVTGGLGPTADDLTRDVMARLAGVELFLDETSLEQIETMFRRRGREMPERNRVQAHFPIGSTPIPNARGTAPGIWMESEGTLFICVPGVPDEMYGMFNDWVAPRLAERCGGRAIVHRTLRCFGAGESTVEQMLGDMIRRGRSPEVGITVSEATITLRVTAKGANPAEARALAEPDVAFIRERLGELVYGEEADELHAVTVRRLIETGTTLATAESCTGGLVGHLLTEVPGSSRCYLGGVVAYSNAAKQKFLGIPRKLLDTHGAVSPEVASAMAAGVRRLYSSDIGLGITGIAGPDGGTAEKPVGLVYIALAHPEGVISGQYNWPSSRSGTKLRSAKTALNLVRLHLRKTND